MRAYKCDRCKKFYERYTLSEDEAPYSVAKLYQNDYLDLCPECLKDLKNFVDKFTTEEDYEYRVYRKVHQGQDGNGGVEVTFVERFDMEDEANKFVTTRKDTNGWVSYFIKKALKGEKY